MPKITIIEKDSTKAGSSQYENFTVLVPGYCKEATISETASSRVSGIVADVSNTEHYGYYYNAEDASYTKIFDENGIYECNSLLDFNKYIGKREITESSSVAAANATLTKIPSSSRTGDIYWAKFDENPSLFWNNKNNIYQLKSTTPKSEEIVYATGKWCTIITSADVYPGLSQFGTFEINSTPVSTIDNDTYYCIIASGSEGADKADANKGHYGNKCAYELLNMGYTVAYKMMDNNKDWKDSSEGSSKKGVEALSTDKFWSELDDKSVYDFRYIMHGLISYSTAANNKIAALAATRKDCIAICEIPNKEIVDSTDKVIYSTSQSQSTNISNIESQAQAVSSADKYSIFCAPYVEYKYSDSDSIYGKMFPASFHYLACADHAFNDLSFNEWYAVAGYTRGISNYTVDSVGCKLGDAAVQKLQPRNADGGVTKAVNLVIKLKDSYYLWGNRTANLLRSSTATNGDLVASDFLNIRQLCTTLKKSIYQACRKFTYDQNSDVLWTNFCGVISPVLEKMKANQGIKDYAFVKVETSKKATLCAQVRIVPIEAVEDFVINVTLEDSLSGSVEFEEEE